MMMAIKKSQGKPGEEKASPDKPRERERTGEEQRPRHHHETPFGSHEDLKLALLHRIALSRHREEQARSALQQDVRDADAHLAQVHRNIQASTAQLEKEHHSSDGVSAEMASAHRHLHAERHRLRLTDVVARDAMEGQNG